MSRYYATLTADGDNWAVKDREQPVDYDVHQSIAFARGVGELARSRAELIAAALELSIQPRPEGIEAAVNVRSIYDKELEEMMREQGLAVPQVSRDEIRQVIAEGFLWSPCIDASRPASELAAACTTLAEYLLTHYHITARKP